MKITNINNWLPRKYFVVIYNGRTDSYWSTEAEAEARYNELRADDELDNLERSIMMPCSG